MVGYKKNEELNMSYVFFWVVLLHMEFLIANVSEHSVCSIFIGEWVRSVTAGENFLNCCHTSNPLAFEDGTDRVFRNAGN
jgi:hypothetical protein